HLAPAAAHCGEGINETADSYSPRGCGVPGTTIRYSAGNKQPCHSLFPASPPRAPRPRPKALTDQEIKGIIAGYCFMLSCSRAV
ncbi:hypothetical protein, partial [Chromobacterium violaceum]